MYDEDYDLKLWNFSFEIEKFVGSWARWAIITYKLNRPRFSHTIAYWLF